MPVYPMSDTIARSLATCAAVSKGALDPVAAAMTTASQPRPSVASMAAAPGSPPFRS